MRLLIGAACVSIILAVGYYFWQEYERSQRVAAVERQAQEHQMLKDQCETYLYVIGTKKQPSDTATVLSNCFSANLITPEQAQKHMVINGANESK